MPKFWPAVKNTKCSRTVKFKSDNLIEKLENLLFNIGDELKDVPNIGLEYVGNSFHNLRIVMYMKDYVEYQNFNWININYVMSDYVEFQPDLTRSFWFVEQIVPKYKNGELFSVDYILSLDEWNTFYDYIYNIHGNVEIKEMHNNRWVLDKDNNYIGDYINNPYILNCDDYCSRYGNKVELQVPYQLYDTKHIGLDLQVNPQSIGFFEINEKNEVTKQIRGWILLWCDKDESGKHELSIFNKIIIPMKLFIFPVFDNIESVLWENGIKDIQKNGYRIKMSNIISDILVYTELQATSFQGWYEGKSENFTINISNGFIDSQSNFIDKFVFTKEEIKDNYTEPHLYQMTHSHYELSNVGKNNIVFDQGTLLRNQGLIQKPNEESSFDKPMPTFDWLLLAQFNNKWTCYRQPSGIYVVECAKVNGILAYRYYNKIEDINLEDFLYNHTANKDVEDADEYDIGSYRLLYQSNIFIKGKPSYMSNNILTKNPVPMLSPGVYHAFYKINQGIRPDKLPKTSRIYNTVNKFELNYVRENAYQSYFTYDVPYFNAEKPFVNITPYINQGPHEYTNIRFGHSDMQNPGPYDDTIIGYDITGYANGKYQATHWYVNIRSFIYKLPIGKLFPSTSYKFSSDYFWYDDKVTVLTKNIGYFSPEEMGLKSILLDSSTSVQNKINNNNMTQSVKGTYSYPYMEDSYTEFLKNNLNQFNAGYANIDAKEKLGKKQSWENIFWGGMLNRQGGGGSGSSGGGGSSVPAVGGGGMLPALPGGGGGGFNPISAGLDFVSSLLTSGFKSVQEIARIELEAQMGRRTLDAQMSDAKNLQDNIGVTGTGSTMTDTILKETLITQGMFENYWNFWSPVLHKFKLIPVDEESVKNYFNKYGYKQDRMVSIKSLNDLIIRWAFNRIKISNPIELITNTGLSSQVASGVAVDLLNGIWVWDLDKVEYDSILDYTINNYELQFWDDPNSEKPGGLDQELESEVN